MKRTTLLLMGCILLVCLLLLAPVSLTAHHVASFAPTIEAVTQTAIISPTIPQDGGGWPPCCRLVAGDLDRHPMPALLADGGGWPPCCRSVSTVSSVATAKPLVNEFKS